MVVVRNRLTSSLAYRHAMSASDTSSSPSDGRGGRVRSRRWMYVVGAGWLLLASLAGTQWLSADDSTGRWLAGVQFFLGVVLALGYAAQASKRGGREGRD